MTARVQTPPEVPRVPAPVTTDQFDPRLNFVQLDSDSCTPLCLVFSLNIVSDIRSCRVCPWLLFQCRVACPCTEMPSSIDSFFYGGTFELFPVWGHYRLSCHEHPCDIFRWLYTLLPPGCILRSGVPGSQKRHIFSFLRNCRTLLQGGSKHVHAHPRVNLASLGVVVLKTLPVLVGVQCSHCGFNLSSSNDS